MQRKFKSAWEQAPQFAGSPLGATQMAQSEPKTHPAEKARRGEIILRTGARRFVFVGGLAAAVIFALVVGCLLHF
jgi:hypothetical protein